MAFLCKYRMQVLSLSELIAMLAADEWNRFAQVHMD